MQDVVYAFKPAQDAAVSISLCGSSYDTVLALYRRSSDWAALQEAWKPFKVAWKAPWWDSAATPEDMTPEAFREGRLSSHTQLHTCTCTLTLSEERFLYI